MADSSCSGSTPFKSLVEHGAQDRSLHQDRITGTPGIQQGFRSIGSASSAQAQADFSAFLEPNGSGHIGLGTPPTYGSSGPGPLQTLQTPQMEVAQHSHRFSPSPYQFTSRSPSGAAVAAAHMPHQHNYAASSPIGASSWAEDFARFSGGVSNAVSQPSGFTATQHHLPTPVGLTHHMMSLQSGASFFRPVSGTAAANNHGVAVNNAPSAEADFDLEMDRWMAAHGDGRMEDVDAVMEQLAQELEQEHQAGTADQTSKDNRTASVDAAATSAPSVSLDDRTQRTQSLSATEALKQQIIDGQSVLDSNSLAIPWNTSLPDQVPDLSRLGLDEASKPITTEPVEQDQPQSEISEAARQILQSVQHEQGDKWKNSRFLLLMRDFRDGNKDIVNDEILETSGGGRIASN